MVEDQEVRTIQIGEWGHEDNYFEDQSQMTLFQSHKGFGSGDQIALDLVIINVQIQPEKEITRQN